MQVQTTKQNGVVVSVSSTGDSGAWGIDCVVIDGVHLPPCRATLYPSAAEAKAAGIAWGEAIRAVQQRNEGRGLSHMVAI